LRTIERKRPWLSRQAEIPLNTIHGWTSKQVLPRADEAVRIARALGTTVEYLVDGKVSFETSADPEVESIVKAVQALPLEDRKQVTGYIDGLVLNRKAHKKAATGS
jgi:hypothetical protein